jgi:hypothetical protein
LARQALAATAAGDTTKAQSLAAAAGASRDRAVGDYDEAKQGASESWATDLGTFQRALDASADAIAMLSAPNSQPREAIESTIASSQAGLDGIAVLPDVCREYETAAPSNS